MIKLFTILLLSLIATFDSFALEPLFNTKSLQLYYKQDSNEIKGFTLLPPVDSVKPELALVLSGGGARGFAQIGVLKCLEEHNIEPDIIVGTSIGAFVGGLYASGYSAAELEKIADTTSWDKLFTLTDVQRSEYFYDQKLINDRSLLKLRFHNFSFVTPEALTQGNKLYSYLQSLLLNTKYHSDENFDSLKIPFRAVATDLVSGKMIAFNSGNIINIIRASGTFPLWTTPVAIDSMLLVDGGLFANLPNITAKKSDPDFILSVNTTSPLLKAEELHKPWNIADQVVSVMMKSFTDSASKLSDLEIIPDIGFHKNTDFKDADSLINIGYKTACNKIPELIVRLDSMKKEKIKKLTRGFNIQTIPVNKIIFDNVFDNNFRNHLLNNFDKPTVTFEDLLYAFYREIELSGRYVYPMFRKTADGGIKLSAIKLPQIKNIRIISNVINSAQLAETLQRQYQNQYLNRKNFRAIAEKTIGHLREKGYPFAFFQNIEFNNGNLTFFVKEGSISDIRINGTEHIDDYLVQRELHIEKGDILQSDKIIKSYENLISSDLFTNVQLNIQKKPEDSTFQAIIDLREKGNQLLSFGASINNERYLQLGLDLIQYNIFNTGLRFSLRAAGGIRNFNASALIMQQRLLRTHITGGFKVYYNYIRRWVYERDWSVPSDRFKDTIKADAIEEGFGLKAAAGLQLVKLGNIRSEYRYERQRHYNNDQSKTPYYTINTIKFISVIDSRDNLYFPKWGRFIELSYETSLFPLKNDASFSKLFFNYQSSHSFGHHTLRPRVMLGFADKTLPQNEFFNLGGENLFFGMRENESRGRQLVLGSLEYQYKAPFVILFDTYFAFRYDLGTTWEIPEEIKFSSLRHGVGLSIGLDTPIGPARFSAGESFYFRQNPYMAVWGYLHLYFSIGVRI